jgi:hypothetical protein
MIVHRIEQSPSRALHHFFEAQVRSWLSPIRNVFVQRTCPSKKRDRLCFEKTFTANAHRGGAAPQRWRKKYWRWIVRWQMLFLSRWHVRLRGRAERSVGVRWIERLFYIMCLCNPQVFKCASHTNVDRGVCIRSHYVI